MRARIFASLIALTYFGCGDSHTGRLGDGGPSGPDAAGQLDGGAGPGDEDGGPVVHDGGPIVDDGGPTPVDGGPIVLDAGPAPDRCESPGTTETVPCGNCGTVERFCTAEHEWAYGACEGEGECAPGTVDSVTCGNCGMQSARCTAECAWEVTGACTGEGECAPGERVRTSVGCPSGQMRELACDAACTFVEETACMPEGCSTPGLIETVACGMCGQRQRFCTADHIWEYDPCTDEGVCLPGTTATTACGMCGMQTARCTTECTWTATGACMGEGLCEPGTMSRTPDGCPPGETRLASCNAACGWDTIEACTARPQIDVMLLFDVTGSHAMRVADNRTTFITRLINPLLALGDVAVGIAYYADFPIDPYGFFSDAPFEGGIEPTTVAATIETELSTSPSRSGNDFPESGIEALSILTGGTPPSSALPLSCSSGREAGGCWRPGATRIVILYTDAPQHNGPDPFSSALYSPYTGITPAPATWATVSASMTAPGTATELIVLVNSISDDAGRQHAEMITDLGQPSANLIDAPEWNLAVACDAAVARVSDILGP